MIIHNCYPNRDILASIGFVSEAETHDDFTGKNWVPEWIYITSGEVNVVDSLTREHVLACQEGQLYNTKKVLAGKKLTSLPKSKAGYSWFCYHSDQFYTNCQVLSAQDELIIPSEKFERILFIVSGYLESSGNILKQGTFAKIPGEKVVTLRSAGEKEVQDRSHNFTVALIQKLGKIEN